MITLGSIIAPAKSPRAGNLTYPILSMTMHNGLVDQADKFKKRVASEDTSAYKVVSRGQLVVGFPIDEGVLSVQKLYDKAIVSPAYAVWDISRPDVDKNYLEKFLRSPRALAFYLSKLRSTTARRRSIPADTFLELPVPLPPVDEQKRIAAILDKADQLRQKRRQAIALLDGLAESIFVEMFGDTISNPKSFPIVEFGSLIKSGPTNGLYKPASAYGEGTRILRINNFYDGAIVAIDGLRRLSISRKEQQTYSLTENDIVINRVNSREYLGKSALVPRLDELIVFESNMMRLSLDTDAIAPKYCIDYLQSQSIKQQIARKAKDAVNQSSINQSDVKSLKMMLPPVAKQREYAKVALACSIRRELVNEGVAQSGQLFASLQYRAFNGQL
ncbi:restriction endonuclease subunit S [Rhizobium leguminosarum]|uniref:restriction endonuclease subunit S n=1 Tax=Rhizobium leguminosarum TaxID=384 RepID=UPI0036DA0E5A